MSWRSSADADVIIRPLTLDYARDQYDDLARDGFLGCHWRNGHDEIAAGRLVASTAAGTAALWAVAASSASVAETELTVRSGRGSLPRYRTGQVHAPAAPASPGGPALELAAAFAATPYLLGDF